MNLNRLLDLPNLAISKMECRDSAVTINASVKSRRSRCPTCGRYSNSVHDYYYRYITDIQVLQNSTLIILKTRKFQCRNSKCSRRVFTKQTTAVERYSRRTTRAGEILNTFSIELTGKLGSQLSKQLFVGVSISTITRIAHSQQLPTIKQPRVLGADDWIF
jgi:transposase